MQSEFPVDPSKCAYRILNRSDWLEAQAARSVPLTDIDLRDGYFHLSPEDALISTANLYFKPESQPVVLVFEATVLGPALVWEKVASRNDARFPHLYSDALPVSQAHALIHLEWTEDGWRFGERVVL